MLFTFPGLAVAGALLALLPIVIHLLNRRRRRRVAWGAMDFLLQSDRKNRTWVQLSEWLLLASRALAVALAGALAALPTAADLLAGFFGAGRERHVVVLDDTCSMRRQSADTTAGEQALAAVGRLVERARSDGDEVRVVRYTDPLSGAEPWRSGAESSSAGGVAGLATTAVAASPALALEAAADLCSEAPAGVRTLAYVMSDFAESSHAARSEAAEALRRLGSLADGLLLAACGDATTPNLAVEGLGLAPGPVAAGVETRVVVDIVNHSDETSPAQPLTLRRDGKPLSVIEVGPFEPRERRRFETPLLFTGVGLHIIEAALPPDRLTADDTAQLALDTPASQPVTLVDDSDKGLESLVFASALSPRGATRSGWAPRRVATLDAQTLSESAAVVLLDVQRPSDAVSQSLHEYVARGGGALLVVGPRTESESFNQRFATIRGEVAPLVNWRLGPATSVPVVATGEPAVEASSHAAVRSLTGPGKAMLPLLRLVAQRRILESDEPALRPVATTAAAPFETLIRRIDGEPLLVESRHGEGRVMALLTTAATGSNDSPGSPGFQPWSNLATLPIFPLLTNDLVGWLAAERLAPPTETLGATPPEAGDRSALERFTSEGSFEPASPLGPKAPLAPFEPGVYRRTQGAIVSPPFATRIDPRESDLRAPGLEELRRRWKQVARVGRAEELFREESTPASRGPLYATALGLLLLLGVERWLAYQNSYVGSAAGGAP